MLLFMYIFLSHSILCSCEYKYKMKNTNLTLKYSLVSTKIIDKNNNMEKFARNLINGVYFEIQFKYDLKYEIYIRQKPAVVVNTKTEFYIYENDTAQFLNKSNYSCELVEGFITSERYSSYVLGYVEDACFYGKVQVPDTIYYIEKLANYPEIAPKHKFNKNAVSFKRTLSSDSEIKRATKINYLPKLNLNYTKIFKRMAKSEGNICSLLILVDHSFITHIHGGNTRAAIKQVLLSIDEANSLFRSTDFDNDGYADNIGFIIKYFILLKSTNSNRWIPKYQKEPIDGRLYMNMFSRFYLLEDVCLGVAFTGQSFYYDIVGISYSAVPPDDIFPFPYGGICDRPLLNPYGLPLNTLAVSGKSTDEKVALNAKLEITLESIACFVFGKIVPFYIFELSLCHEFGHSFGADHDEGPCEGYLMTAHAPTDQRRKRFIFSNCSKQVMLNTIRTRNRCFDNDDNPYCGNGLIETNEECDCGTIRDCTAFDHCCVPRGRRNSCQINRDLGYECHPSQGFCCSDDCYYRNLEKFGLDCKGFQRSCPCSHNTAYCKCGVNGRCTSDFCSSEECTRIDAEECICPNQKRSGCMTCCQSIEKNISCFSADVLTRKIIKLNSGMIPKLKMFEGKQKITAFGVFERFCNKRECVKLFFRKAQPSEFCLLFGQVGICSRFKKCLLPSQKLFKLKNYEINKKIRNGQGNANIHWSSMKLFVICYILLL